MPKLLNREYKEKVKKVDYEQQSHLQQQQQSHILVL